MVSSNGWKDMYCAFFKETYIFLFFIKPPMEYDSHVQYCRTVTDREEQLTEKAVAWNEPPNCWLSSQLSL